MDREIELGERIAQKKEGKMKDMFRTLEKNAYMTEKKK